MRNFICAIVTSICLLGWAHVSSATDVYELVRQGETLTADQAKALEVKAKENPDDVETQSILLGYYFQKQFKDQSASKKRSNLVLSLIANAPEAEILSLPYGELDSYSHPKQYSKAKKAFLAHLKKDPENAKLIENAAVFLYEDSDLAEELLKKGKKLQPKNSIWSDSLGEIYSRQMIGASEEDKVTVGKKALKELELAYELSDELGQDPLRSRIATVAINIEDADTAKKYALKMLQSKADDWNTGNNVHDGNAVLGRVALLSDDVEEAKKRLLAAGKTEGSPQLDSFGPNMTLAKELLERGEKKVVLEYFKLCSKFWEMGDKQLQQWTKEVEAGRMPAFGANLNY